MKKQEESLANQPDGENAIRDLDVLKNKGKTWTKPQLKVLDAKKNTHSGIFSSSDGSGYS